MSAVPTQDQGSADGIERSPVPLVEHFFRHESGRLVATLARVFSLRNLDLIEDMVQSALLEALRSWQTRGVPENPSAWLHRVARNKMLDALRRRENSQRLAPSIARMKPTVMGPSLDDLFLDDEIEDSQLRMIFACCHSSLSAEDQIALTLKTLCGFGNAEIARALLVNEETVKKRLHRAKEKLVELDISLEVPIADELAERLDIVHHVLYLMFNEGYASSTGEQAIREDICEEAARLCHLLACNSHCNTPATFALLALMLFHAARLGARTDAMGRILLLDEQDRTKWDRRLIARAKQSLDHSAQGNQISTYHLQAAIAMHHCFAADFASTDWAAIVKMYDALLLIDPSPVYVLNRAIAVAHLSGPVAGIVELKKLQSEKRLANYHLLDAALGELYRRIDERKLALQHFDSAKRKTTSVTDHELIERRIQLCESRADSNELK